MMSVRLLIAVVLLSALPQTVALLSRYHHLPYQRASHTNRMLRTRFHHEANDSHQQSRSTSDPDYEGGIHGNESAKGRDYRRERLHIELSKFGIDPDEIQSNPDHFGTSALRTYNSFIFPKSAGALAVAESPTRAKVVANNMSFLIREYRADRERWLRNVDQKRGLVAEKEGMKHSITIILDNVRSASNVGNILRLGEAAQVESIRLCGESGSISLVIISLAER